MDKLKQWIGLTLVAVLAVLAAGWFLLIAPKRADASALRVENAAQTANNAGLRSSLAVLKAQAKNEPADEAKLAKVAAKIPDNPALPALIRALDKAAASTGIDLISLAPGAPTALALAAPATVTPTAPIAAGAPAVVGTTPLAAGSRPAPVGGGGTVASIPVTLNVKGTYFQALEFVDALEALTRAFKVAGLAVAPAESTPGASSGVGPSNKVSVTVTGTVYMAVGRLPVAPVSIPKTGK
jgi:Tfp pilus assembly protein PilO